MAEAAEVKAATNPHEVLLVADALTGQDAVNTARAFDGRLGVTGIVLTRMDGDARGGAALSMRAVTGKPIKLVGTGEKVDALEEFHPSRVASRILGMGDIVSLVEKAAETHRPGEGACALAQKMRKGKFDLEDLRDQLAQMEKIGGIGGMLGMLPGIGKMKAQIENANLDDKVIKRQRAIIDSMTPAERRNPDLLKASRKKRIAAGSGTRVEDVNKLLKMHRQMADVMKMMGGGKGKGIGRRARQHVRPRRRHGRHAAADAGADRGAAEADGRQAAGLPRRRAAACRRCRRASPARAVPACRASAARSCPGLPGPRLPVRRQEEVSFGAGRRPRRGGGMSVIDRKDRLKGEIDVPQDPSRPVRGAKKRPYYRIVVADSRSPRDGRFIEKVGTYDPMKPKDDAGARHPRGREDPGLARQGRPADRPRAALPRRRRPREARAAQQPAEGRAGQEGPGARRRQGRCRRSGRRSRVRGIVRRGTAKAHLPPPCGEGQGGGAGALPDFRGRSHPHLQLLPARGRRAGRRV